MSFFTSLRRALPAATLLLTLATAQSCYYPDGKTLSEDIPCNSDAPDSACCGSDSFCLGGGLCLTGGIVSRGSCTDKTWGSEACSGYCKTESTDGEIAITPCTQGESSNTFVCGLDNGKCDSNSGTFSLSSDTGLVLRPSQIAALVGPALASSSSAAQVTVTAPASTDGLYTAGAMAGLGVGIAIPLLIALGVAIWMIMREKKRWGTNKHMYKLPDNCKEDDFEFKAPPPVGENPITTRTSATTSRTASKRPSLRTLSPFNSPLASPRPSQISPVHSYHGHISTTTSFADRNSHIQSIGEAFGASKVNSTTVSLPEHMHELDSSPAPERERFELSTQRMST